MIKALIFDLDNTLIDRQRAFKEMLLLKFKDYAKNDNELNKMVSDVLLWDDNGKVERSISFSKWADKYNIDIEIANRFVSEWSKVSGSTAYLFEDVRDTLKKLKEKYLIAILSNGNASSQRRKMQTIDIYDLFDYSLISGECEYKKPQKEIFIKVLNDLNIKAEEAIYIGDTYSIDIEGSRNAGLKAIYVSRNEENHLDVTTIYNIKELLELNLENIK